MSDVALAIIADSSIALASQWPTVLQAYVSPLLSRLVEGRTSDQFNVSIVIYATADYRPTPILAKRYFSSPQHVSRELREDFSKLGIGRTCSGGKMGMAALEGYAAALEMFDLFLRSQQAPREAVLDKSFSDSQSPPLCHIIHITSSEPDEARYPMWNQTSNLDTLSWKTLPDELRKRSINLNLILLRASSQFSELHTSMISEPQCQAWFVVRPGHTILLSSQSGWAPMSAKRLNEDDDSDKTVDAKRPRVSTPVQATSANVQPDTVQTAMSNPQANGSTSSLPPGQINTGLLQSGPNGLPSLMQAVQKLRAMDAYIKAVQAQFELMRQQGRVQDAESLKKAAAPKFMMYKQLRQYIINAQKATASASAGSSKSSDAKPEETAPEQPLPALAGQNQLATVSTSIDAFSQLSRPPAPQSMQQLVQAHRQTQQPNVGDTSNADSGNRPSEIPTQFSPSIAAQMQKLKMREGIQGQVLMSSTQSQMQQQHGQMGQTGDPTPSPSKLPHEQSVSGRSDMTWVGTLSCIIPQSATPIEVQVQVLSRTNIRPELWPPKLSLMLSAEHAVALPTRIIKDWITRHEPAVCQIRPLPRSVDPQENARAFKSLAMHLFQQNVYAVGSWALPSTGIVKPTLLVFPTGNDGKDLFTAVFPETGIPELPRTNTQAASSLQINPNGPPGSNVMTSFIAAIQNMSPEGKKKFMDLQRVRQQQLSAQATGTAGNSDAAANLPGNLPGGVWPGMQGGGNNGTQLPFGVSQQQMAASLGLVGNSGQGLPNLAGIPGGMNINMAQALAIMQQQRQNGMPGIPGPQDSSGPPF